LATTALLSNLVLVGKLLLAELTLVRVLELSLTELVLTLELPLTKLPLILELPLTELILPDRSPRDVDIQSESGHLLSGSHNRTRYRCS
jgi:hypothetical protein